MQCFGKMCQMWLLYSTTNCGNQTSKILSWKQIIDEYKHSGIQYCMYIIYTIILWSLENCLWTIFSLHITLRCFQINKEKLSGHFDPSSTLLIGKWKLNIENTFDFKI